MSDGFEKHIQDMARSLPYPATPAIHYTREGHTQPHKLRPLRYAAMLLLVIGLAGFAAPDIRAAILEFLQVGIVTIYLDGTDQFGDPLNLDQVAGEATLAEAQAQADFALLSAPDDLPDRVFVQDAEHIIFVWLTGDQIERVFFQATGDRWRVIKTAESLMETQVGERAAYWASLVQPVQFVKDGSVRTELTHFVSGNVLGWENGNVTYRLETNENLDEARTWAESLVPLTEIEEIRS